MNADVAKSVVRHECYEGIFGVEVLTPEKPAEFGGVIADIPADSRRQGFFFRWKAGLRDGVIPPQGVVIRPVICFEAGKGTRQGKTQLTLSKRNANSLSIPTLT